MDNNLITPQDNAPATEKAPFTRQPNRKKYVFVACTALLIIGVSVGAVLSNRSKDANTQQPSQATEPTQTNAVGYTTIPGMTFTTPNSWLTVGIKTGDSVEPSVRLQSPDFRGAAGYVPVSKGTMVTVSYRGRDSQAESGQTNPLDTYLRSVGSPRVDDPSVDFYERPVDWSKYYRFTNANGIEMVSYTWEYEGCSLVTTFMNDTTVYNLSTMQDISQGDCPSTDLINSNPALQQLLNSVKFQQDDTQVSLDVSIGETQTKPNPITNVIAHNVSFTYQSIYSTSVSVMPFSTQDGILVPVVDSKGVLSSLEIGPPEEVFHSNCGGTCSFLTQAYGTTISYSPEILDTTGFTELSDKIFATSTDAKPVQANATAYKYTYRKGAGTGTFTVSFIVEIASGEPPIKLDDQHLIDTINTLQLLNQ